MRRRRSDRATAGVALIVLAGLAGCSIAPDDDVHSGVVVVAIAEPGSPLTPDHADDPVVARILPALAAGLVTTRPDGGVDLELARTIETEDHTVFDVELQPEARFSNGESVTAESFVEAWRRAASRGSGHPLRHEFSQLRGFRVTEEGEVMGLVEAGGLEIVNRSTFRIRLTASDPEFPRRLGSAAFLPLPSAAFDDPVAYSAHPAGAGPYMFADAHAWHPGDRLELLPNPGYAGAREVHNTGISLRFVTDSTVALAELLAHEVDVVERLPPESEHPVGELLDGRVVEGALPSLVSLVVPGEHPRFQGDEGLLRRAALALVLDRDRVVESVAAGRAVPATGFLPAGISAPTISVAWGRRADDARALDLWREANRLAPWTGDLTIGVLRESGHLELARALAERVSAALSISAVAAPFSTQLIFDAVIDAGQLHPLTIRESTLSSGSIIDAVRAVIPHGLEPGIVLDQLEKAGTEPTVEAAIFSAALAQNSLATALPVIPIWSPIVAAGFRSGIEGVELGWGGVLDYGLIARSRGGG